MPHPLLDANGHMIEHVPAFDRYLKQAGVGRLHELRQDGELRWFAILAAALSDA